MSLTLRVVTAVCMLMGLYIYWLEWRREGCFEWIMSFDLKNEVFGEVRLPPNYRLGVGERPSVVIMEFKGLVSVCVYELSLRGGDRCSVWVMKDNGDSVSWTKQFKVVFKESGLAVEVHEEWKAYNGRIGQPELS
ncbi:hypothetical protein LguiA_026694 [Lonicera macranthoides]